MGPRLFAQLVLEELAFRLEALNDYLHAGNVLIDELGNFSLVDFGSRAARRLPAGGAGPAGDRLRPQRLRRPGDGGTEPGARPPGVDLEPLVRQFAAESTELPAEHRFRQPEEPVLFSKNALYLDGLCHATPDMNRLAEIAPIFLYFRTRYPEEIASIMLGSLQPPSGRAG